MTGLKLLIVDDMPQVRHDLRTVLPLAGEAAGLPIEIVGEAGDGLEAIQQAGALRPQIILMDLEMPQMDGDCATREIKALYPGIKVLVLTVHNTQNDRKKAHQAGADGFIEKGALVTEIINQIQSIA